MDLQDHLVQPDPLVRLVPVDLQEWWDLLDPRVNLDKRGLLDLQVTMGQMDHLDLVDRLVTRDPKGRLDKMALLELQNNLQSEIQAKQDISQELSKVRAELEASRK